MCKIPLETRTAFCSLYSAQITNNILVEMVTLKTCLKQLKEKSILLTHCIYSYIQLQTIGAVSTK